MDVQFCHCGNHAFAAAPIGGPILVSSQDAHLLKFRPWHVHKHRRTLRVQSSVKGKTIRLHQLVAGKNIDHKNRNGLDNRRENLRPTTHSLNAQNVISMRGGSKFKGVFRRHRKWSAQIGFKYKTHKLGTFESELAAAVAYDAKAIEFFGKEALLNFPRG